MVANVLCIFLFVYWRNCEGLRCGLNEVVLRRDEDKCFALSEGGRDLSVQNISEEYVKMGLKIL